MDHAEAIALLTSVLSTGVVSLVAGVFIYFLLPKALSKVSKYVDKGTLQKIDAGLEKLISVKSAMDTDPKHEDMVERILRYTELAVHAAEQVYDTKDDNAKKKEYAIEMASQLLKQFKKSSGKEDIEVDEMEKKIMNGLIETVVGVQKKQKNLMVPR